MISYFEVWVSERANSALVQTEDQNQEKDVLSNVRQSVHQSIHHL